jgi:hypothetical protein
MITVAATSTCVFSDVYRSLLGEHRRQSTRTCLLRVVSNDYVPVSMLATDASDSGNHGAPRPLLGERLRYLPVPSRLADSVPATGASVLARSALHDSALLSRLWLWLLLPLPSSHPRSLVSDSSVAWLVSHPPAPVTPGLRPVAEALAGEWARPTCPTWPTSRETRGAAPCRGYRGSACGAAA